jgi:hypothetical protein
MGVEGHEEQGIFGPFDKEFQVMPFVFVDGRDPPEVRFDRSLTL